MTQLKRGKGSNIKPGVVGNLSYLFCGHGIVQGKIQPKTKDRGPEGAGKSKKQI